MGVQKFFEGEKDSSISYDVLRKVERLGATLTLLLRGRLVVWPILRRLYSQKVAKEGCAICFETWSVVVSPCRSSSHRSLDNPGVLAEVVVWMNESRLCRILRTRKLI